MWSFRNSVHYKNNTFQLEKYSGEWIKYKNGFIVCTWINAKVTLREKTFPINTLLTYRNIDFVYFYFLIFKKYNNKIIWMIYIIILSKSFAFLHLYKNNNEINILFVTALLFSIPPFFIYEAFVHNPSFFFFANAVWGPFIP